jgi:kynurenine formamidase
VRGERLGVSLKAGDSPRQDIEPDRLDAAVEAAGQEVRAGDILVVKAFGVDTPTPDNPASRIYPVHLMCRRESLHHYENLGNLSAVNGRRFTFFGVPEVPWRARLAGAGVRDSG